jgi:hypothetical protein
LFFRVTHFLEMTMTSFINEAGWDRGLRVILGIFLLYLGWAGVVTGIPGLVLKIAGFLPLVTGIVGWCPAYSLFGVSTCEGHRRTPTPGAGPTR